MKMLWKEMTWLARRFYLVLLLAVASGPGKADDVLFIGNSFTFGATAPAVQRNGGVPKLVEAIALAQGRQVHTAAVTAGGKDWTYHLKQPVTAAALASKTWTWVILQDFSTRPTRIGDVQKFMEDGETFSERIAQTSPHAGILLYETWARPWPPYYQAGAGKAFSGPEQMLADLQQSYAQLRSALAAKDPARPVRVARVGTAFAEVEARYPALQLDAADHHHTTADGYYLAALVIYETMYGESVQGAPRTFFQGGLEIPPADAAILQGVADEVVGAPVNAAVPSK